MLDEQDGYAYIHYEEQPTMRKEGTEVTWMQRRPLTYEESIMLVLLREMMAEFEVGREATSRN